MLMWAFVRYRFLTVYSRLPPEPARQDPKMIDIILEPDSDTERKSGTSTYLDDFLSAIKVFGYLDRKVFHELTKHMRTHRFEVGETIKLKELRGFSVVVEGNMEVFIKAGKESDSNELHEINGEKYQLLNEIKKPAPLSSLFSILSLFTEDVQLNEHLLQEQDSLPLGDGGEAEETPFHLHDGTRHDLLHYKQVHKEIATDFDIINRDVIARASSNATVSVIPSEAFRNLTKKYPRSTSQIVQVILTRCNRVTLQTCHNYLNLTSEIFKSETVLNNKAVYELPKYLHDSAVRKLRQKSEENEEGDVVKLKIKKAKRKKPMHEPTESQTAKQVSRQVVLEPHESHPGDLLSSVSLSRRQYEM
jgi:lysophospholipid hydrolase